MVIGKIVSASFGQNQDWQDFIVRIRICRIFLTPAEPGGGGNDSPRRGVKDIVNTEIARLMRMAAAQGALVCNGLAILCAQAEEH